MTSFAMVTDDNFYDLNRLLENYETGQVDAIEHLKIDRRLVTNHNYGASHVGERVLVQAGVSRSNFGIINGPRVTTLDQVEYMGTTASVHAGAYLMDHVRLGSHAIVESGVILHEAVQIAKGVSVPTRAEIGPHRLIPHSWAITTLGNIGMNQRVVTIHGSTDGPLITAGCQVSIDLDTFFDRASRAEQTSTISAGHHLEMLRVYLAAGKIVQQHFEATFDSADYT